MKQGSLLPPSRLPQVLPHIGSALVAVMAIVACGVSNAYGTPNNSMVGTGSSELNRSDVATVARKVGEIREQGSIEVLDFSAGGEHVAIKTITSPSINVWDWRGASHIIRTLAVPNSAANYSGSAILRYGPDGHRLAILTPIEGIRDQATAIYIWNSESGELLNSLGQPNNFPNMDGLAFLEAKSVLSLNHPRAASSEHQLVEYSLITGTAVLKISLGSLVPWSLTPSPNGQLAAIGATTGRSAVKPHNPIIVLNLSAHAVVREIDAFPMESIFSHIAWRPDGKQIAAGVSFDARYPAADSLKVFTVETGELVASADPPQQNVADLAYGGAGKYLIVSTSGSANVITIWDSSLRSILQTIPLRNGPGRPLTVSRDGHFLAIADDTIVSIWEIK